GVPEESEVRSAPGAGFLRETGRVSFRRGLLVRTYYGADPAPVFSGEAPSPASAMAHGPASSGRAACRAAAFRSLGPAPLPGVADTAVGSRPIAAAMGAGSVVAPAMPVGCKPAAAERTAAGSAAVAAGSADGAEGNGHACDKPAPYHPGPQLAG